MVDAMQKWPGSQEPNETVRSIDVLGFPIQLVNANSRPLHFQTTPLYPSMT